MASPTAPGEVTTRDKIRLPLWAWALIGGGTLVIGYRFYQARKSNAATAQATGAAQTTGGLPTTVIGPIDNSAAYGNILSAIQGLNGPPSTAQDPNVYQIPYKVKSGDTWASIGKQFGISGLHVFSSQNSTVQQAGINARPKPGSLVLVPWNARIALENGNLQPGTFSPPK